MAFQRSDGLVPDGVAGPLTQTALALAPLLARNAPTLLPPVTPPPRVLALSRVTEAFRNVATVSRMIPGANLSNIATYLPSIIAALDEVGLGDRPMFCMAVATIAAECAGFRPIDEGISRYNTSPQGHPFDLYDNRHDLGNRGYPDGSNGKGRGWVQLTGMDNYRRMDHELGLNGALVLTPWLANDKEVAARILARFLKDREKAIRDALAVGDTTEARKLVNGGTHGLVAFQAAYGAGLKVAARALK